MSRGRFQIAASALMVLACLGLYGWTLPYPFQFDDHLYLARNPLLADPASFAFLARFESFARRAQDMGLDPDLSTNLILRPVCYLTFHLHHRLGGLRPAPMRAVNILIHIATALVLLKLLMSLLRKAAPDSMPESSVRFIAGVSALLFAVHPMQTESVTYIVQRFTSLGTLFLLLTVHLHLRTVGEPRRWVRVAARTGSVASLLLGMGTKEFLVTAPLLLVLADVLVLGSPLRTVLRRAWPHLLLLPVLPAMVILTSWAQTGGDASLGTALNVAAPIGSPPEFARQYALTQPGVILAYLRLLLMPDALNLDHDVSACTSALSPCFWAPLAGLVAIVLLALLWWRSDTPAARGSLAWLGVLWFFLTLSVDSSIVPLPDLMSEHRTYLPSIGLFITLACLLDALRARLPGTRLLRHAVPSLAGAWLVVLGVLTAARNHVWRSESVMWTDVVTKSPIKARAWMNLGVALSDEGRTGQAIECLRRAIAVNPAALLVYINLARMQCRLSQFNEALATVEAGLVHAPSDPHLRYEKGVVQRAMGDLAGATETFQSVLPSRPGDPAILILLGELHLRQGHRDPALGFFRAAAMRDPSATWILNVIAQIESGTGLPAL